jgi:hypothetical protein
MEDPAAPRVVKHSLRGAAIQLGGGATGEVFALIAPTAAAAVALLDVGFLRRVVAFVEHDLELLHYNVMIVRSIAQLKHPAGPGRSPSESVRAAAAVSGYVLRVRGRRDGVESASLLAAAAAGAATPSTVRASAAMDLRTAAGQHITAELTNDDLLIASGARGSRCFIDAKARPCYIAVHDSRFVRRLSELSDAERDDIWSTLFGVLRANHGGAIDRIEVRHQRALIRSFTQVVKRRSSNVIDAKELRRCSFKNALITHLVHGTAYGSVINPTVSRNVFHDELDCLDHTRQHKLKRFWK